MPLKSLAFRIACIISIVGFATTASAQFLLTGARSGGALQIGTGLPLPVPDSGVFLGGKAMATAGTQFYPELGVPANPNVQFGATPTRTIMQTLGTANGGAISLPPAVLSLQAEGTPRRIPVFTTNPAVYQVGTSISYAWPAASAVMAPGGAPGPTALGTGGGGVISYDGGSNAFGGAAQFVVAPGSGAGTGRVPPNAGGALPIATVWLNLGALPSTGMAVAIVGASNMVSLGAPGAPLTAPAQTTAFGPLATADGPFGLINVTSPAPCCAGGPFGTINASIAIPGLPPPAPGPLSNMVTASQGFPWTTGFVTVSQPGAVPAEVFFLSGTDRRVAGVGNVSLVSGALSLRALSGPNANRGWVSLQLTTPEPTAIAGAGGALAALALCHTLVRRRRAGRSD